MSDQDQGAFRTCSECGVTWRWNFVHSSLVLDPSISVYVEDEDDEAVFHGELAELLASHLVGDALRGLVRQLNDRAARDPSWPRVALDKGEHRIREAERFGQLLVPIEGDDRQQLVAGLLAGLAAAIRAGGPDWMDRLLEVRTEILAMLGPAPASGGASGSP